MGSRNWHVQKTSNMLPYFKCLKSEFQTSMDFFIMCLENNFLFGFQTLLCKVSYSDTCLDFRHLMCLKKEHAKVWIPGINCTTLLTLEGWIKRVECSLEKVPHKVCNTVLVLALTTHVFTIISHTLGIRDNDYGQLIKRRDKRSVYFDK